YGFTDGVAMALAAFVLGNLALVAVGSLPKRLWWSSRAAVNTDVRGNRGALPRNKRGRRAD
ncbi:MAG: hypothetical protein LC808_29585, partial [Actinobacteria bacterium]|nr:hypothetical protein [Actinomycetota bacterium]